MRKLNLLINTLSYLSPRQIYFIFFNKLIKGKFNYIYVYFFSKFISNPTNVHFDDFIKRLNQLLGNDNIWQGGITGKNSTHHYYDQLKQNIHSFVQSNNLNTFINLWNVPAEDVEINYNYQRFYLFSEAFEELKVPQEKRIDLLIAWIENNKNNKLAWTGFNCAIRLINWIRIIFACQNSHLMEKNWSVILQSIYKQHKYNSSNVEHHIPGNHVLFQYYSMWLITLLFNEWINKQNEEKLFNKLVNEFDNEFLKNGLHFELSTHYHLQLTLVALYVYSHLYNLNKHIAELLINIINRSVKGVNTVMLGKYYPLIGDGCYCFFHKNTDEDLVNLNYLLSKLKISVHTDEVISNFDDTYLIVNSESFKTIFDIGEIGLKQNPGHGHADILSVLVGYKNSPVFIDPGTKRYTNTSEDLAYKRTSYHNTICVGNYDQATLWGFFRWAFIPKIISYKIPERQVDSILVGGKFEGFYELGGITHEREIEMLPEEIIITDKLEGKLEKFIQISFILHPEVKIVQKDGKILIITNSGTLELRELSDITGDLNISDLNIYESYNSPIQSKKLAFNYNITDTSYFNSKISLKVFNQFNEM